MDLHLPGVKVRPKKAVRSKTSLRHWKGALWATLAAGSLMGCQGTKKPTGPTHRVDYIGSGTFRWGTFEGYSLISFSPQGLPKITTGGAFSDDHIHLILAQDDEQAKSGEVMDYHYTPPEGDGGTVDFSSFPEDGRLVITRRHLGVDYVKDLLETRVDGLEVVGHEPVPLLGDPDPADIINYGNAYFNQRQDVDLLDARRRFFAAGVHYPKLALRVLKRHEDRAEEERNSALGSEAFRYRERFELIETFSLEASPESSP